MPIPMIQRPLSVPSWLTKKAIAGYVVALIVVSVWMNRYMLPWYYLLSGTLTVAAFFIFSGKLSRSWAEDRVRSQRRFEKRLFWWAFALRLAWMITILIINRRVYGDSFGFENGDATFYDEMGIFNAELIKKGDFHFYDHMSSFADLSDMGYAIYLGFVYFFTDNSIFVSRLLKCFYSAFTVVMIYRLAFRNFDETVARVAAIFCMLWPNFWYYCGTHLKEVEMVTLGVLFVEQADQMLRTRNFTAWKVIPLLLISAALFTIRTPLALVSILSLLFTIVMSSTKVVSWGKRIIIGALAAALIAVTMGNRIQEQSRMLVEAVQGNQQSGNMSWRAKRAGGNEFSKYASAAVFAPMIFTIPFPSMVNPYISGGQNVQQLLNGGNYIKNILSGFTIFAMFMLLFSGKWREHLLPLSFALGYLVVLTMSSFPHSERFHQPSMPFEMMFAAWGLIQALKGVPIYKRVGNRATYKRWYNMWFMVMMAAAVAWNWFKLAGRGML